MKYKVGDWFRFNVDELSRMLFPESTAQIKSIKNGYYIYDIYENGKLFEKGHEFKIESIDIQTELITKLERML